MDLEKIWKRNEKTDLALNNILENGEFGNLSSKLPLKTLKTNLFATIVFSTLLTFVYVFILYMVGLWEVYLSIGVLILFNVIVIVESYRLYRKTPSTIGMSNSLKQELLLHYTRFNSWWKLQQKMSLFVYPFAVAGGFIVGGYFGAGKPLEDALYNTKMLGILLVAIVVLVPVCYFGARKMFQYSYGRHLEKLKMVIDELDEAGGG